MKTILCATLSLFLVSCSEESSEQDIQTQEQSQAEWQVQLPSPFMDCDTVDQAEKIVGFAAKTPHHIPLGYAQSQIQTIGEETIQIFYNHGENQILFRQAKGDGDISGDYNKYEQEKTLEINDTKVLIKGNNNKVNLATWQEDEYTYSLMATPQQSGLEIETLQNMISSIK